MRRRARQGSRNRTRRGSLVKTETARRRRTWWTSRSRPRPTRPTRLLGSLGGSRSLRTRTRRGMLRRGSSSRQRRFRFLLLISLALLLSRIFSRPFGFALPPCFSRSRSRFAMHNGSRRVLCSEPVGIRYGFTRRPCLQPTTSSSPLPFSFLPTKWRPVFSPGP